MASSPVAILPLGAIIQELRVGSVNIVQGFPEQEQYPVYNSPFFGETIGRVANRIGGAKINSLNGGQTYQLAVNDGVNNLHGGAVGWGKKIWNGPTPVATSQIPGVEGLEGAESFRYTLVSEDGDEGFPGKVDVSVVYTVGKQVQNGREVTVLGIEYEAELAGGADETVINMTNHSYFNLTGGPSIEGTVVTLATNSYLPVDNGGIPTGGPAPFSKVEGNKPFTLGAQEPDIDDCFIVNETPDNVPIDTRASPLTRLVSAEHPESKIHLEVLSTEPAFQFYTGKYIDVPEVAGVPARGPRSGFCVEPSRWVNACNVDEWKSQMLLKKGETYGCRIVYRAWQE